MFIVRAENWQTMFKSRGDENLSQFDFISRDIRRNHQQ